VWGLSPFPSTPLFILTKIDVEAELTAVCYGYLGGEMIEKIDR